MREFQSEAKTKIERVLENAKILIDWNSKTVASFPLPAMNHTETDIDIYGTFTFLNNNFKIWIYPDDLELKLGDESSVFEHQDYPNNPDKHVEEFCSFLRGCLITGKINKTSHNQSLNEDGS